MKTNPSAPAESKRAAKKPAPSAPVVSLPPPSTDAIAEKAYALWVGGGCRHGHDHDDWVEAERQLTTTNPAPDAISAGVQ